MPLPYITYNTTFHAYAQASTSVSLLSVDGQPGVLNAGLLDKQRMLEEHHKALREFPSMPIYTAPPAHAQHRLLTDQLAYYGTALAAHLDHAATAHAGTEKHLRRDPARYK